MLHSSRTQTGVALLSAWAELNAALKMGCEILGLSKFCREFGDDIEEQINDSSAVKFILARRGYGKVKHLEVRQLWLQEQVRPGKVDFHKVSRQHNPSGALTHRTKEEAKKHFKHTSQESCSKGLAGGDPEMRRPASWSTKGARIWSKVVAAHASLLGSQPLSCVARGEKIPGGHWRGGRQK